jgi:molecular chaperone DnaJ
MAKDFYAILGVNRDASAEDIKRAYRKLSKQLHPDKHKGDKAAERRYQEINEAYEVLNDPKKREFYDRYGSTSGRAGAGGAGFSGFQGFGGQDFGEFSDIFESFFGGRAGRRRAADERGANIEVELRIDLQTAVTGARQTLRLRRQRACETCGGNGAAPGSELRTCDTCNGTGQVTRSVQSFFGVLQQTVLCAECGGRGKVPDERCKTCRGEGRHETEATVAVEIPAGIHDGQALRLRGEGHAGPHGSPAGDLLVHIAVEPDRHFERDGDDIRSDLNVSVLDAILGAQPTVRTVQGDVTLKIPAGSQPNQVFRLRGKGMPVLNTSRHGDHYATLRVEIPQKLSRKEKKLLEEWKELQD